MPHCLHKPDAHFFMFSMLIPWKVQPSILTYIIPCSFCGDSCEKYRWGFQLDYPIHVKCRKIIPSMNVRIKKIWKNILPNTQVCKSVVLLGFVWLIERVIAVRVYMYLLRKLILQGNQGRRESEGISYLTQILKIMKLHSRWEIKKTKRWGENPKL